MTVQTDFLSEIIKLKQKRLDSAAFSLEELKRDATALRQRSTRAHVFRRSLQDSSSVRIIAEFKRASPSKGRINSEADPVQIARAYKDGGAAAVSVLTEEDKFLGSPDDLRAIRAAIDLPLLRKDFIFTEEQIYESALMGADALLLIVAALDDELLNTLRQLTEDELGMDALVEVHTPDEFSTAQKAGATIIGVNNRNLRTFNVSLETSETIVQQATPGLIMISESGLNNAGDLKQLVGRGYHGFLIGENLMRAERPAEALRTLIQEAS